MKKTKVIILAVLVLIGIGFFFLPDMQSWWREYQVKRQNDAPPVPADLQNTIDQLSPGSGDGLPISSDRTNNRVAPKTDVLAYITGFEQLGRTWYIAIDYVNWLTGDAAKNAALAAGECRVLADCAPNGFYIENNDASTESFRVASSVTVQMQTYPPTSDVLAARTIDFDTLRSFFATNAPADTGYLQMVPYNIAFSSDGSVVKVTEKYVP